MFHIDTVSYPALKDAAVFCWGFLCCYLFFVFCLFWFFFKKKCIHSFYTFYMSFSQLNSINLSFTCMCVCACVRVCVCIHIYVFVNRCLWNSICTVSQSTGKTQCAFWQNLRIGDRGTLTFLQLSSINKTPTLIFYHILCPCCMQTRLANPRSGT